MVHRFLKQVASVIAVVPLLVALGCDATDPTAPAVPPAAVTPNYDFTMPWARTGSVTLIKSPVWSLEFTNSTVIGPNGGRVSLGFHELIVPKGAVTGPTKFTMTAKFGAFTIVDLTAVDQRTRQRVTQFPVELQLRMSYWLLPIPRNQLHRLVVVWLKDNSIGGELVPVRTTYRPGDYYVVGWLTHFSQFAMAME
jgi:hypothetical protein